MHPDVPAVHQSSSHCGEESSCLCLSHIVEELHPTVRWQCTCQWVSILVIVSWSVHGLGHQKLCIICKIHMQHWNNKYWCYVYHHRPHLWLLAPDDTFIGSHESCCPFLQSVSVCWTQYLQQRISVIISPIKLNDFSWEIPGLVSLLFQQFLY